MAQDVIFKDELKLIEAEDWGMNEEVDLWIETTNLDEDVLQMQCLKEHLCLPKLNIMCLKVRYVHLEKELTISWYTHSMGESLDCTVMMQPNPS